jgi:cytochrome o ubiquinol oxidase subunit I
VHCSLTFHWWWASSRAPAGFRVPPLSQIAYSPGVGVDHYLWALQISGVGTLLTGVNFVTTVLKIYAPGLTYTRMPMSCWTTLASNLLIVAAFPILTATLAMLLLDRYLGFHFFGNEVGGNVMMFMNLIWHGDIRRFTSSFCPPLAYFLK